MQRHPLPPPRVRRLAALALAAAVLAGCASAPPTAAPGAAPHRPRPPGLPRRRRLPRPGPRRRRGGRARAPAGLRALGRGLPRHARAPRHRRGHLAAPRFDDVQYLPRVVELDRAQPEFTRTVWDYLDTAVSPQRVAHGQDKLQAGRARGRRRGRALRRARRHRRRHLGHGEQLRRQLRRHADHRRAGHARLRRPPRGTGRAASCWPR